MPKINFQSCVLGYFSLIHYVSEMRSDLHYLSHMKNKNSITPQAFSFPEEKMFTFFSQDFLYSCLSGFTRPILVLQMQLNVCQCKLGKSSKSLTSAEH